MRTRGDVGEISFFFSIKRIARRPIVQLGINLGKIPRVFQLHRHEIDNGVRRHLLNIGFYMIRQIAVFFRIKQLHAVKMEIMTLIHGDIRPPLLPTPLTETAVQYRTEKADGDLFFGCSIHFQTTSKRFFPRQMRRNRRPKAARNPYVKFGVPPARSLWFAG